MIEANEWRRYSSQLKLEVPAIISEIEACERELHLALPLEYKEFLMKTNGAEGPIGEHSYAMFWRVSELSKLNEAYQVPICAPGYLLFGSDGGGEAFAFEVARNMAICSLPFVGMSGDAAASMGATFWMFLETLWRQ